jgi:DNA-binding NarL/FixJ family response regulator
VNLCQCGCGGVCKRGFIRGHYKNTKNPKWRATVSSAEHSERISKSISAMMADPEFKKRHREAVRESMQRQETKIRRTAPRKKLPEEKIVELYKRGWLIAEIAREIDTGLSPKGVPRRARIRSVLKRAGVYPRQKTKAALAGK